MFCSTRPKVRRALIIVLIKKGVGNFSKESVALCHQVTTLDYNSLAKNLTESAENSRFQSHPVNIFES
jgi:mRNA-degrading endonuclease toxin of MazEF toxin-antitoxin module